MIEKGIVLAGGNGSRLYPVTRSMSKQLLGVYDKPLIYYPISTLMLGGITEILVITRPEEQHLYRSLLGDGLQWGIELSYAVQETPRGLADAFLIGQQFINEDPVALILGDNIFYSEGLGRLVKAGASLERGASIYAYYVKDPHRYGVVEFEKDGSVASLEEKPINPKSSYAVPGLYFYDNQVCEMAHKLQPSARGELEITALNRLYLEEGTLKVQFLGRGTAWFDTGTYDSLLEAANFVATIERRQGLQICCPEEIAYRQGLITAQQLAKLAKPLSHTEYGQYLLGLIQEGKEYFSALGTDSSEVFRTLSARR